MMDDRDGQVVLEYLQMVLAAVDTVLNEPSPHLTAPGALLDAVARRLVMAFSPCKLSEPLPPLLQMRDICNDEDDSDDDDEDDLVEDKPILRKQRRLDFLRCVLRCMAPIAMDVVAIICDSQPDPAAIVLLFGSWLPLAPHIMPLVSDSFGRMNINPLESVSLECQLWHLMEALHSITRHFSFQQGHRIMAQWWSWTPLFAYLMPTNDVATSESGWTFAQATRWHAARTLGYFLDMSPGTMGNFLQRLGVHSELVPWVLHPWVLHQEEVEWEIMHQKGIVRFFDQKEVPLPTALQIRSIVPLNSSLVHVGNGLVFSKDKDAVVPSRVSSIVLTSTTQENIALVGVALAFEDMRPVLLTGPTASGKSSIVRHLCTCLGRNLLELHVDDDTDSKTLIGSYQTTDIPGEFTWQPGALTRAIRMGSWVLLEDLDTVPLEIQAALIPLLEQRSLPVGSSRENEVCHPGFRLFATLSDNSRRQNAVLSPRLWRKVGLQPLRLSEWLEVANAKYPKMPKSISKAALIVLEKCIDQKTTGRQVAVREFLKLLSRISNSLEFSDANNYVTEAQRMICLAETLDVFAAHSPDMDQLRMFASQVAAPVWEVTADSAIQHLFSRRPELIQTNLVTQIGRAVFPRNPSAHQFLDEYGSSFAPTDSALRLMESILVCVRENEPTLLVGETGCGKTTILQQLAHISDKTLIVQNLSLQTDSTDLLGGYRPVEIRHIARTIYLEFVDLFVSCFSRKKNADFLNFASTAYKKSQWKNLSNCFRRAGKLGLAKIKGAGGNEKEGASIEQWYEFVEKAERFERQRLACETKLAFAFTEGALVEAIRTGKWVLLDEINLASSETLQRLCGLLDDTSGSITLTERGDAVPIARHSGFRLFAAMNPATDTGKKDLPQSIRTRFTEIYVEDLTDPIELRMVAGRYLSGVISLGSGNADNSKTVADIIETFLACRALASKTLVDASGQRPRYTLRTLCRALTASKNLILHQKLALKRGILEGFELAFEGALEVDSLEALRSLLRDRLGSVVSKEDVGRPGRRPGGRDAAENFVLVRPFWIIRGPLQLEDWSGTETSGRPRFILTKTMTLHLRRLARAVAAGPWPVLLEGPTSAGKTTLVEYLAARCSHKVVRINNHEHTDVQEYTGSYASDENGSLSFRDGILVQALRKGHWVILDELNLAPCEVLEALNRLLDDNRELYLAEVNEIIKPHANFRLFATQNPCGAYGGRKPLSRAFRNRFVEIHMGDIPSEDMITILEKRSGCPSSHARLLVGIMSSLRQRRSTNGVFLGKDGLITPRDLLRWAERRASSKVELAEEGFMLLGERLRSDVEREAVREEIESNFKVSISCEEIYFGDKSLGRHFFEKIHSKDLKTCDVGEVAPTRTILRLVSLVLRCVNQREPVLLVGDTGCGKTTVVQLVSRVLQRELKIVNCHATTETSDLIGGLRPVRGQGSILSEMCSLFRDLVMCLSNESESIHAEIVDIFKTIGLGEDNAPDDFAQRLISTSRSIFQNSMNDTGRNLFKKRRLDSGGAQCDGSLERDTSIDASRVDNLMKELEKHYRSYTSLFEWVDGSLVQAMRKGHIFLLDEISLAEDAVLERLNSVLEPSRKIVLAEKGDVGADDTHVVEAHTDFLLFATMNPGGDFGKRELSPALRSRFTEIWVPTVINMVDIEMVLDSALTSLVAVVDTNVVKLAMLDYVKWFNTVVCADDSSPCSGLTLSMRDVIAWATFVTAASSESREIPIWERFCHGASLMHLDGLGLGTGLSRDDAEATRMRAIEFLLGRLPPEYRAQCLASMQYAHLQPDSLAGRFGTQHFSIPFGPKPIPDQSFNFRAPTTASNVMRVLRAMQLSKPILLEGSPGVGKTSLVSAVAKAAGYNLVRINLSEQTDLSDLMGSDLPVPDSDDDGESKMSEFKWSDGALLRAIKRGDWVLLDELNLATQSVLEGLNSCLDHRASVYIPELGETFRCPASFRVFAAQNPLAQGGGRKGLPKSFLNRFTKVYVEPLSDHDLKIIVGSCFPNVPNEIRSAMVDFNSAINTSVVIERDYGDAGSPWEFNLRDVFRWCELAQRCSSQDLESFGSCARDLYLQRFRSSHDRLRLSLQFRSFFHSDSIACEPLDCFHSVESVTVGSTSFPRSTVNPDAKPQISDNFAFLRSMLLPMEAVLRCVLMSWPCLLVGPPASGKTSLLRTLASYLNVKIVEVSLTHSTDVNELVGGFEQIDYMNDEITLIETLKRALLHMLYCFGQSCDDLELATKGYELLEIITKTRLTRNSSSRSLITGPASAFLHAMKRSKLRIESSLLRVEILLRKICENDNGVARGGRFAWVDGVLVDAMVNGYWLLLENVNLCSSSVLDRLNPVMEPGGELLLTETGTQGGATSHRSIKPHQHFRLFLSMNPDCGEVSRAMRNRCVEVSLPPRKEVRCVDEGGLLYTDRCTVDQVDVLSKNGVRTMEVITTFLRIYQDAVQVSSHMGRVLPSLESPRLMATGFRGLRSRGFAFESCIDSVVLATYEAPVSESIASVSTSSFCHEAQSRSYWHTPMVPGIREIWSSHHCLAVDLTQARLTHCLQPSLPLWLRRFKSADEPPREVALNQVCDGSDNTPQGIEWMIHQSLLLYACASIRLKGKRSSLIPSYSNKQKRALTFFSRKLSPFQGPMLSVLIDRLALLALEVQWKKWAEKVDDISTTSGRHTVYDVSFWLYLGKIERSFVQCPITPAVFGLVQTIDDMCDALEANALRIERKTNDSAWIIDLQRFFRVRDQFCTYLKFTEFLHSNSSSLFAFDISRFIVQWIWLKKATLALDHFFDQCDGDLLAKRRTVDSHVMNIDRVLLDGDGSIDVAGYLLWKKGGHPLVPAKASHWEGIVNIRASCLSCTVDSDERFNCLAQIEMSPIVPEELVAMQHPVLFSDNSMKHELLGALSMAYFCSTEEPGYGSADILSLEGNYHVVCKKVEQAKASFAAAWKALQIDTTIGTVENSLDVAMLEELQLHLDEKFNANDETLLPLQIMRRFADVQISPVVDFWLIHAERQLVSDVSSILLSSTCSSVLRQTMTTSARRFVSVALSSTSWRVTDLRPFQTLVWAFDSQAEEGELIILLRNLFQVILHAFSNHLWRNSFNNLDVISPILECPLLWSTSNHGIKMPAIRWRTRVGPSRMRDHVRTETMLRLIGPEFSLPFLERNKAHYLTLENHQVREAQSKNLLRQLSNFQTDLPDVVLPFEVFYLFSNVIEALEDFFPDDGATIILSLLRKGKHLTREDADDLQACVRRCTHSGFNECYTTIVAPLVDRLINILRSGNHLEIPWAWMLVGLLRVHLLVPPSPLDPGLKPIAKVEQLESRLSWIRRKIATIRLDTGLNSGEFNPTNAILEDLELEAKSTIRKRNSQQKKIVQRPQRCSPFIDLFRAMRSFWKSTANASVVLSIVDALKTASQNQKEFELTLRREQNWQVTAASFSNHVTSNFNAYEDVVVPFVVGIQCIQRGLREVRDSLCESVTPSSCSLSSCITDLIQFPFVVTDDHLRRHTNSISILTASSESDLEIRKKCAVALSISALSRLGLQKRATGFLEPASAIQSTSIIDGVVKSWLKHIDSLHVKDPNDDFEIERTFREQFPDHSREFVSFMQSTEQDDSDDVAEKDAQQIVSTNTIISDDLITVLYELYRDIFSEFERIQLKNARLLSFQVSYGAAHLLRCVFPSSTVIGNAKEPLGTHCFALALSCDGRAGLKSSLSSLKDYSFYRDPNPVEVKKALAPLQRLFSRTSKLLNAFPGHEILTSIGQVAEFVRKLDLTSTSVGKAMSGLELVLRKAQEWEEHASERVKLGSCLREIRALVASWRKVELANWASLLVAREVRFAKRARRHWIRLFSVVNGAYEEYRGFDSEKDGLKLDFSAEPPSWIWKGLSKGAHASLSQTNFERLDSLVKLIDTFILTSCLGEFQERMELVRALKNQFMATDDISGVSIYRIFASVDCYYSQFLQVVLSQLDAIRSPIESKLKDEVKLAKWDDQSYYSLVDSTERNHRKLMKLLREYDDCLELSVWTLLEQTYDQGIRAADSSDEEPATKVPSNKQMFPMVESIGEEIEPRSDRFPSFKDRGWKSSQIVGIIPDKFIRKMPDYRNTMTTVLLKELERREGWASLGSQRSDEICSAIFDRLQALRKDKTSRQVKQRAFSDLFKALNSNGFMSTKWSIPSELRDLKHIFHLPIPQDTNSLISGKASLELASARDYFNRCLIEVQRLRAEVLILGSKHFTLREMDLMTNTSNHGLLLVAQQRTIVAGCIASVARLKGAIGTLLSLSGPLPICQSKLQQGKRSFVLAFCSARETLGQLELLVSTTSSLGHNLDFANSLRDTLSILHESIDLMNGHEESKSVSVITSGALVTIQSMCRSLVNVKGNVLRCHELCSVKHGCLPRDPFETTVAAIEKATEIGTQLIRLGMSRSEIDTNGDDLVVNQLLTLASKAVQLTLVFVQKVLKKSFSESSNEQGTDDSVDVTIWKAHKRMCREWEEFNVDGLTSTLLELTTKLVSIHESEGVAENQRKWLVAVASDVGALVEPLLAFILSRVCDVISFFRRSSKLQYVLLRLFRTLVSRGYCSGNKSNDPEGEGHDGGDLSGMKFEDNVDGTGMGEGEGKEDVTDQLESEEQMLGLKNDVSKEGDKGRNEARKLEEEEAKKGMEMEADFDGEMFDIPDDNEGAEAEDDEGEELDREMGDCLNDDDDVVDEKLWGDSDDEDEINRQEEKFEKDSKVKGEAIEGETRTKDDTEGNDIPQGGDSEPKCQSSQENSASDGGDDQDHTINEDLLEKYEEKHEGVDFREDQERNAVENMDLEEDLNLGDGEENSDEESHGRNEERHEELAGDSQNHGGDDSSVKEEPEVDDMKVDDDDEILDTGASHEGTATEKLGDDIDEDDPLESDRPRVDMTRDDCSRHESFGVKAKEGNDKVVTDVGSDEEDSPDDQCGQASEQDTGPNNEEKPENQSSGSGGNQGLEGPRQEGSGTAKTPPKKQSAPNPFRDPGDAAKFWHKKLNMVEVEERTSDDNSRGRDDTDEPESEPQKDSEYTYAAADERSKSQLLGETQDEPSSAFENKRSEDEIDNDSQQIDETKVAPEQEEQMLEQVALRNGSKPTSTSEAMNMDLDDDDNDGTADIPEEEEMQAHDTDATENMVEDVADTQGSRNQVVSDLRQLQIDDDVTKMSQGNVIEVDELCGMSSAEVSLSRVRWNTIASETNNLARRLCEKLRLVMEPLLATKLKGDYRTGKRINMKKVIGYIASGYRKDKIWLRRTKPAKRNYRILLAVDNSESMLKSGAGDMALAAMATLAVGMSHLEIGELGIASFGDDMRLLHPFNMPFTLETGPRIIHSFPFDEKRTRTALCISSALAAMDTRGDYAAMQLMFIISDGRIERDSRSTLRRLIREMVERNILLVMIIVEGKKFDQKMKRDSIVRMKEVTFENGKPKVKQFMEDYPFPYYIILEDMQSLPEALGDALRQWFEMLAQLQQA